MSEPAGTRFFASDNAAGVHPEVMAALAEANFGHAKAYGADPWTTRATDLVRLALGWPDAHVSFVFNGTGANVCGLQLLMRPHEAVICAASAHINVDECGAPERLTGGKLFGVATPDGKLTPETVAGAIKGVGVEHHSQPRVVAISQATEYGTVYGLDELARLQTVASANGLALHVDGARLANAAVTLGVGLGEATGGADIVSLGGTKNGMMYGEAVVARNPGLAATAPWVRKQTTQLASKMRFVAAQFIALLEDDLWRRNAAHANAMAAELAAGMARLPGVAITQSVEANEVFARIPAEAISPLQAAVDFYVWDERLPEVRWVTSWDTTREDVARLLDAAAQVLVSEGRNR
jgi:threonine aldolase